jgi:hypothetical protein
MMLISMLSWWYTAGWASLAGRVGRRVQSVMNTFSVQLLAGSLFEPFRQISAGQSGGPGFDAQLKALGDRLFSRIFGAVVRSLFILMGLVGTFFMVIIGLLQIILWPVVPLLPILGIALSVTGWTL